MSYEINVGSYSENAWYSFGPASPFETQDKMYRGGQLGKESLGKVDDGYARFRIAKNGATVLKAFAMTEGTPVFISRPAGNAAVDRNEVTFSAGSAIAADAFKGGYLMTLDTINGVVVPERYPVYGNTASVGTTHRITVTLAYGLRRAVANTTAITIVSSPYYNVKIGTASAADATGMPLVDIPSNHYYLTMVGGIIPARFSADVTAGPNAKEVVKAGGGLVKVKADADDGATVIGHLLNGTGVANTGFSRWGLINLDIP